MNIQNQYGLIEEYLDQGDYFAPVVIEGDADITVIDQYNRLRAYAEYGDGYAEVVSTDTEAEYERVINQYWIIERIVEVADGIYARVVTTDPGEDPIPVIDPHGLKMLYASIGDGTHALVIGGFADDVAIINKHGIRVGYVSDDGAVLPGFGLAIRNTDMEPITSLSNVGDEVTTFSVPNLGASTVVWSLVDDAGGLVEIDSSTGVLTIDDIHQAACVHIESAQIGYDAAADDDVGREIIQMTADYSVDGGELTWSLTDDADGFVEIDADTGLITIVKPELAVCS